MANNDNTKNHDLSGEIDPELQGFLATLILAVRSGKPLSEELIPRELSKEEITQMIQCLDYLVQESTH